MQRAGLVIFVLLRACARGLARKGFADRASQEGELFGVNPARLISMRDAGASLVCM